MPPLFFNLQNSLVVKKFIIIIIASLFLASCGQKFRAKGLYLTDSGTYIPMTHIELVNVDNGFIEGDTVFVSQQPYILLTKIK